MAAPAYRDTFPRGALIGAACLVGFSFTAALGARVTGIGRATVPGSEIVEAQDLRFEDRADGAVVVRAAAGDVVEVIAPGQGAFVRGTVRGLVRERRREKIGAEPPFRLSRLADGRLALDDTATGRRIELNAFGPSNRAAFASLMDAAAGRTR